MNTINESLASIANTHKKIFRASLSGMVVKGLMITGVACVVVFGVLNIEKKVEHVAAIEIKGEIKDGGLASYDAIAPLLEEAFENEKAKAVLIKLSSPGGSSDQSLMIYDKINELKAKTGKPVDAVITEMCASGCYFIASSADNIYSQKTSIVGSIGVITKGFDFTEAMNQWGVKSRTITAGDNKAFMDPYQKMTDTQVAFWKEQLQETHKVFVDCVKSGRGTRLASDAETQGVFSGLAYAAPYAKKLGLIDGYATADQIAKQTYKVDAIVDYNIGILSQKGFASSFQAALTSAVSSSIKQIATLSVTAE